MPLRNAPVTNLLKIIKIMKTFAFWFCTLWVLLGWRRQVQAAWRQKELIKGGLDEESNSSSYHGRSGGHAGPGADGVGSRHHYDDGDWVAVSGRPEERWSCHPSAGGRATARVGRSDLRNPEAQVDKPGFCGPALSWSGPFGAGGSLHPPGSFFVAVGSSAAFLVPVLRDR